MSIGNVTIELVPVQSGTGKHFDVKETINFDIRVKNNNPFPLHQVVVRVTGSTYGTVSSNWGGSNWGGFGTSIDFPSFTVNAGQTMLVPKAGGDTRPSLFGFFCSTTTGLTGSTYQVKTLLSTEIKSLQVTTTGPSTDYKSWIQED